jgi:DNA polymerase Ligase (LigD)
MPRFVVLRHEFPLDHPRATHWDMMLEWGTALRTWALAEEPLSKSELQAEPLPDHWLEYLDYEGPISGHRGSVARWDSGEYHLQASDDGLVDAVLSGTRLRGQLKLRKVPESHFWRVSFSAEPTIG